MKKIGILIWTIVPFLVAGCEDVIDLDLASSEQRIVIEAVMDAGTGVCVVHVSKTAKYYETNQFEAVKGAVITLRTSAGATHAFSDSGNGTYSAAVIAAPPGDTLTIAIALPGPIVYHVKAVMPGPRSYICIIKKGKQPMNTSMKNFFYPDQLI